jgi:hypothetical protein
MPKLPDVSLLGERDPRPSYGVPNMPRNPIPAALEGMGNAIQGAAINLRNEQKTQQSEAERVERYAYTTKLLDFERQERDYLTKSSEGVAPGAADFTKTSVTGYDQRAREFFKDVPAHLRPEMDSKLVQLRGSIEGGAQKFESEEGRRYHGNRIDDSLTVMLARQKQNPDAWTDIQKEGEDLIRNAPIFSNVEKDEKIRAWKERRVVAWVTDNPGKARKAMAAMDQPQGGGDIASGIRSTADALGIDPVDLATAISYETAGTFDPAKGGPVTKWGRHRGLIQFGESQAKQFGVDWNDPVGSQLGPNGAIAKYLKAAGVKPGMGLMDIYSAINAGGVGRYGASDANNGGAPGTVADKVNNQMAAHRAKAEALLGGKISGQPSSGIGYPLTEKKQSAKGSPPIPPELEGVPYETLQKILVKQDRVSTQFMDDDIASIRSTGVPLVQDPQSVIGSVPDDKAESYLMGRALAEQYHGAVTDMQQMPDDQLQARVEQMRPAPGSANFEALQKNYQDVQTAANAIREQRKKDPAGYVMATNAEVAEAWKNFDPKNPATAKAAIGETVFAQKSIGIPSDRIAPLPAQQAESVAAIINDTEQPVDARIQTLVGMIGITGDEDQQQAIFNQLSKAGVSDKTALVFDAYMRGDVGAARRLFEAATVKAENMPGKAQRAPGFEDAVSDAMFGAGTAGEVFYSLDLHDPATTAIAQRDYELVKTAATLAMAAGKDQDEAIDQAIKDVHGPVIRVNEMLGVDGNVRGVVPEGTDTDALIAGMAAALPAVKQALQLTRDTSVSGFIANNGTAAKPVADATGQVKIDDIMAEGLFRNHGNGWAFFDPFSNAFVQDAGGNIMTWTTDDFMLMRLPDEIRPPPGGMSGNGAAVKDVPAVDLSGQPASAIDSYFPPAGAN